MRTSRINEHLSPQSENLKYIVSHFAFDLLALPYTYYVVQPVVFFRGRVEYGSNAPVQSGVPAHDHAFVGHVDECAVVGFERNAHVEATVACDLGDPVSAAIMYGPTQTWPAEGAAGYRRNAGLAGVELGCRRNES